MKILILGSGTMGAGFAKILSKQNNITLYDPHFDKASTIATELEVQVIRSIDEGLLWADMIILCFKPKDLKSVSHHLNGKIRANQSVISILSGTSQEVLKSYLGDVNIIRMMPNIACFQRAGIMAFAENGKFFEPEKLIFQKIFEPLGKVLWLEESKFDAFTALAGSGPAFVFLMVESMIDASLILGISKEMAREIALQMFQGAITTLKETGKHPGELKWEVSSPGGCTIAGIKTMEDESIRSGIINTFLTTYEHLKV